MAPLNIGGPVNLAVVAGALVLLSVVARAFYNIFLHPLRSFPGPLLWRVSTIPRIYWLLKGRLPHKVAELHAEYGPVLRIMPDELSFSSADAWDDIYGHRKHGAGEFPKDERFYSLGQAHNIVFSTREDHAALRRALSHGFSERSMREQEPIIGAYVDLLIQRLRENSKPAAPSSSGSGQGEVAPATLPVNMREWLNWTTFDVIGDLGFGSAFGCLEKSDYHPWVHLIAHNLIANSVMQALRYLGLMSVVRYYVNRGSQGEQLELVRAKLRQRMELGVERPDLIEGLIRKKDDLHLSFENLAMNANVLIIAGSETTATLLSSVVFFLTSHPDKLARVAKEVRTTFNSEEEIGLNSVSRLSYMLASLNEALRLYPPVATGLPRQVPKGGAYVAGHFIPEKTAVAVWQWVINYEPKYWTEPTKFAPERFLGDPLYEGDRLDAMQPFSTGPRNCIGKNLAYAEMRLILAKIVWNFDMVLEDDSRAWLKDQKSYILWDKPPLNVRLTPVLESGQDKVDFQLHHNGHTCTSTTRILKTREKTVAQLRDAEVAQQNDGGDKRYGLQRYFEHALVEHGHPFVRASLPVIAGLILDSHYSVEKAELEDAEITAKFGTTLFHLALQALHERLDHSKLWGVEALGMNGMAGKVENLWVLLADQDLVKVAGVGATVDGAVVYYSDGRKCNCGVAHQTHYGGCQSQEKMLSEDETLEITRVSTNTHRWSAPLKACQRLYQQDRQHMEASEDERIVGF
ncbi:hypothetical protein DL764_003326 [Monosporascus ibericus]|uniref:Uncharacterized protein n=1 Tax=Monosporascus ibericus TaxID=155417 RepID=A0A4Q4TKX0_9PEZI|nr:hypothetical protein DL764_003326 [Monosporascus ibericus]